MGRPTNATRAAQAPRTLSSLPELRFRRHDDDGRTVLALSGVLDVASAPLLREHLLRLYDNNQRDVTVDLGNVSFIDSSGLGLLVAAAKRYREVGGDIRLRSLTRELAKMLDLTGLSRVFSVES